MNRKTSAAITTACVSMAACTAAYMMTSNKTAKKRSKQLKKSTDKAMRQVGDFIDSVSSMMR